mgnify:CR=1 FL=1
MTNKIWLTNFSAFCVDLRFFYFFSNILRQLFPYRIRFFHHHSCTIFAQASNDWWFGLTIYFSRSIIIRFQPNYVIRCYCAGARAFLTSRLGDNFCRRRFFDNFYLQVKFRGDWSNFDAYQSLEIFFIDFPGSLELFILAGIIPIIFMAKFS